VGFVGVKDWYIKNIYCFGVEKLTSIERHTCLRPARLLNSLASEMLTFLVNSFGFFLTVSSTIFVLFPQM
jgi:hypothetical protein